MPCSKCGAETVLPNGHCTSCDATIALPPVAAASTDDATRLSGTNTPVPPGSQGPLQAGEAFGSRYRVLRVLGSGGMGVVYQTWDEELGMAVALKVIRSEVMADPQSAQEVERRFKRELVLARQVTHKNVVRIHDIGEVNGTKYLTMPFVDGRDLASILRESGSLPIPRALRIARQVAAGLQAAHEAGVVHRDLKPENIMIDAEDQAVIMDFGVSRSVTGTGAGTVLGAVVGTLEYMAPEQGRGIAVDQRADIYAFGLLLYDMIGGRQRLLTTESAIAEMMSRMTQPPPPLRARVPQVPEALDAIVTRCLQPDPDQRFQKTSELVAALDALTADGQSAAKPPVAPAKRRGVPMPAAIAALVVALGIGGWLWFSRTTTPAIPAAREPVSVLIADFDNQAQDPVFDGLVEQALAIGIENASFLTVYPRRDAMRRAQQVASSGRLDVKTANLISLSEGIDVIVSGAIRREGNGFKLLVRATKQQADGSQHGVLDTTLDAADREAVLPAVGKVAAKVRAALGDVTADAERAADAETFTAGSIEAAHVYAKAQELSWAGRTDEAIEQYKEAVRLDPEMGRAYSGLAALYSNLNKRDEAAKYFGLALQKIDRMTEREKYRTRSAYYLFAREPAKAIEESRALLAKYPADTAATANLSVALAYERRMREAQQTGRKAVELYPRNILHRTNAALFAMYASDFAAAEQLATETLKLNADRPKAYVALGVSQLAQGRPADAQRTWQRLEAVSGAKDLALEAEADLAMFEGRLADALTLLTKDGESSDPRRMVTLAEVHAARGNLPAAAALASAAADTSQDPAVLYLAGRILAEARRPQAAQIAASLQKSLSRESRVNGELLAGEIALQRRDLQAAHDAFMAAQKFVDTWLGRFGLARTAVAAGSFPEADSDLEECLKRRGEAASLFLDEIPTYRFVPALYYYLGLSQAGQSRPAWKDSLNTFLSLKAKGDEQGLVADARRRLQQR
jgi:eukaryotic-like serine/threonine-protein kinase